MVFNTFQQTAAISIDVLFTCVTFQMSFFLFLEWVEGAAENRNDSYRQF